MNVVNWLTGRFSIRGKALTLYRRGMARVKKHDCQGAIDDYTTTIDMRNTPAEVKAMVLYNRALAHAVAGEDPKATEDTKVVLAMKGVLANVTSEARRMLVRMQRRSKP
jgi:hypothetical protein